MEAACQALLTTLERHKIAKRLPQHDSMLNFLLIVIAYAEQQFERTSDLLTCTSRLLSLLEQCSHDSALPGWQKLATGCWKLFACIIDHEIATASTSPSRHVSADEHYARSIRNGAVPRSELVARILLPRMFSRLAKLLSCRPTGQKQNVMGACILAELAIGYHKVLSSRRDFSSAQSLLLEILDSAELKEYIWWLIKHSGSVGVLPQQRITDLGAVSKWLHNVQASSSNVIKNNNLRWILQIQAQTLTIQLRVIEDFCSSNEDGCITKCLGPDLDTWCLPHVLLSAKAVLRAMTELRTMDPSANALDIVWAAVPEVLSVCHTVLHTWDAQQQYRPSNASFNTRLQDHTVLAMVNDAVHLVMQCLACAAPAGAKGQAPPLAEDGVGYLLLLLARVARLAQAPNEQLQQLLNIAGVLNLLAHLWRPDELPRDEVAELALAARQLLASLLAHMQRSSAGTPSPPSPPNSAGSTTADAVAELHVVTGVMLKQHTVQPGQQLTRPKCLAAAPASSGSSLGSQLSPRSDSPPLPETSVVDSKRVYSTVLHLVGAVHNLSLAPQRTARTTHDSCMEPSKLAGLLQWQLFPLTTALLEEAMLQEAPLLSPARPPSQDALSDIYNILSIIELQSLVGTDLCDGCGSPPWKLFYGGNPAGLHMLATMLSYCRAAAKATGGVVQPPRHIQAGANVIVGLAAAVVRGMDVRGPLQVRRQANTDRSGNGKSSHTGTNSNRSSAGSSSSGGSGSGDDALSNYLGPGWHCALWGFAALAVWQEASALAAMTAPGTAWRALADSTLRGAAPCAVQLLLRAAEEIVAASEEARDCPAAVAHAAASASRPTATLGGLSRLLQPDSSRQQVASAAANSLLCARLVQKLDNARERLCALYTQCEAKHLFFGDLTASSTDGDPTVTVTACKDRCLALAKALLPLLPATTCVLSSFQRAATAFSSLPEPWSVPWHAHPAAWIQWEAAQLRLPRDQRGCSNPFCASQDGCAQGQFLAMHVCATCGLARFCSGQCYREAACVTSPHCHTCPLLLGCYGGLGGSQGATSRPT